MKTLQFISLFTLALLGCKDLSKPKYTPIVSVQIHDVIKDSLSKYQSFRNRRRYD